MIKLQRSVKFESDRTPGFGREVMSVPGCEALESCIQCGTCSGVCPLSVYMDITPRQVIKLTRDDFKSDVLKSTTIWLCASCYACTCECPREIRITDIMYELKQRALKEGVYPKRFPIPVLAQAFSNMASSWGRVSEMWVVVIMILRTNWFSGFKMWRTGINLMRTGRFSLAAEKIKRRDELARMMATVENVTIDSLAANNGSKKAH